MLRKIDELPVVLTSFAYRSEYFPELDGMLATIKEHHPEWGIIAGKGPVPGAALPTLEVVSLAGNLHWALPVPLNLDGSEDDWRKVTRMKAWWMSRVWHHLAALEESEPRRVIWLDADARLNGKLDIELEPERETIAAPRDLDPDYPDLDIICSGLLFVQGAAGGPVERILDRWSSACLAQIQDLRPPTVPWLDGDQEVLNEVIADLSDLKDEYKLLKLEHDKYAAYANRDGTTLPGALVDQWQMSRKMKFPECRERDWPPPEEARRRADREKRNYGVSVE